MWNVEYTDEFAAWWDTLSEHQPDAVARMVGWLEQIGPMLGRPDVGSVRGSRHSNMKELRVRHAGSALRVLFAFDPRRAAILLIGGDKKGDDRFYERMIPRADELFDLYLDELKREGLI